MTKFRGLLVPLALLPVAVSAQTTVFSTNFSTGERVAIDGTYDVGDWTLASTKNTTGIAYGTGAFAFGMGATTSGFVEAQSRFTTSPVTLGVGQWIQANVVFTATNNLLSSSGSSLVVGLYDTGGNNPALGLDQSGLTATNGSAFATGNAQTWTGYNARFAGSTGSNSLYTRLPQVSDGTESASENQDVLFSNVGSGAYDYPAGVSLGSGASSLAFVNASQYTLSLRLTLSAADAYTVDYNVYAGTDTSAAALQTISRTSVANSFLGGLDFDGFGIGYRQASSPGVATSLTLNEVTISTTAIPEPSTYAALAGVLGLGLAVWQRRRRA